MKLYIRVLRQKGSYLGIAVLTTSQAAILPAGSIAGFSRADVTTDDVKRDYDCCSVIRGLPLEVGELPIAKDSPIYPREDKHGKAERELAEARKYTSPQAEVGRETGEEEGNRLF